MVAVNYKQSKYGHTPEGVMRAILKFVTVFAVLACVATGVGTATPAQFTTNPYKVINIGVYVDNALTCTVGGGGLCTSSPDLTPGWREVRYVWATCNNPATCAHYGEQIQYVMVPDQAATYVVKIPTVRVRWFTVSGMGIKLNGQKPIWAQAGGKATANVMAGCYTISYHKTYPADVAWPVMPPFPGIVDSRLKGFENKCFGSSDTYPASVLTPDNPLDVDPPHVRIIVPANY